jgi:HEAT repeat protein
MAEALTRLDRDEAVKFLRRAMAQPDAEIVLGALGCVWQLGEADLVEAVLALIEEPPSDHVLTTACQWLGTLSDTRAVDALVDLLSRRPRFFGLVRGTPEAARVTAARALAEVDLPRARAGLRNALKDPSVTVRATARQALG